LHHAVVEPGAKAARTRAGKHDLTRTLERGHDPTKC
jgi:hypothetical protein